MAEKEKQHGYIFLGRVLHSGKEFQPGDSCPSELVPHLLRSGVIAKPLPVEKEPKVELDKSPEKKLAELKEKEKKSEK